MSKKQNLSRQFKGGYVPQEPVDSGSPLNGRYSPPAPSKKRNSLSLGSETEARPGMVGKNDFSRRRKK